MQIFVIAQRKTNYYDINLQIITNKDDLKNK